uniref:BAR domain-containing protein n=1 Tax=Chlamydomonas euryale TaxID=1486919 RepID=A0A7R9V177_9CHLO|mmetsp:Transcript_12292/g.36070  ORF Transcript_12292/g.36070 Transcript_12292/m.36070 type:complete len:493 (+) Transcript_12292:78-1556(+)
MSKLCGCTLPVKEHPAGGQYVTVDSINKLPPGYTAVPVSHTPGKQFTIPQHGAMSSPIVSPATSPSMVVPPGYAVSPDPPHSKSAQPQWASKADQDLREFGTGVKHIFRNTRRSIEKTSNKAYKATGKAVQQAQADIQHLGVSSHGGAKPKHGNLHLTVTRNHRNNMMINEIATFARQVQLLHYDLSTWSNGVEAGLTTMKAMLDSPLPIPYDHTENGVAAFDPEPHAVGHSVETNNFISAIGVMKNKLEEECLGPLGRWMEAVASIQERNLTCHKLGLDVDQQALVLCKADEKLARCQQTAPEEPGLTPEAALEAALINKQTEEDKLVRLEQRFTEMEADVFNHIVDVMHDAQVVREYAASGLVIMQGAVHTSLSSFDLNAKPDPYNLPPQAMPDIKVPAMAPVKIPMADMRSAGLYTFREKLCTHQADPLAAASEGGAEYLPTPPEVAKSSTGGASTSAPPRKMHAEDHVSLKLHVDTIQVPDEPTPKAA